MTADPCKYADSNVMSNTSVVILHEHAQMDTNDEPPPVVSRWRGGADTRMSIPVDVVVVDGNMCAAQDFVFKLPVYGGAYAPVDMAVGAVPENIDAEDGGVDTYGDASTNSDHWAKTVSGLSDVLFLSVHSAAPDFSVEAQKSFTLHMSDHHYSFCISSLGSVSNINFSCFPFSLLSSFSSCFRPLHFTFPQISGLSYPSFFHFSSLQPHISPPLYFDSESVVSFLPFTVSSHTGTPSHYRHTLGHPTKMVTFSAWDSGRYTPANWNTSGGGDIFPTLPPSFLLQTVLGITHWHVIPLARSHSVLNWDIDWSLHNVSDSFVTVSSGCGDEGMARIWKVGDSVFKGWGHDTRWFPRDIAPVFYIQVDDPSWRISQMSLRSTTLPILHEWHSI